MFVHLHNHSPFSFLDGSSRLEELIAQATEFKMPAIALTDHNNLCGAVKFHKLAMEVGIKPILGVEVTLTGGFHLVLLAKNHNGYKNLCGLLTESHLALKDQLTTGSFRTLEPKVSFLTLNKFKENLFALSGCRRGEIPSLILNGKFKEARTATEKYLQVFGSKNFFLELQQDFTPGSCYLNKKLVELAAELKINIVATNNCHYTYKEDFKIHDLLTCVRNLIKLKDIHPQRPINGENYLKSPKEMLKLFKDYPDAIKNTLRIAEECTPALVLGEKLFPSFPPPKGYTPQSFLRELTYHGAKERYKRITPKIKNRLEHELDIICQLGYEDYFLLVWDIANYARRQNIRFAGRGSAADSAVAYCLFITEVDSIGRNLLFERFMSLERSEKPDIDIDFDARYRDQVSSYVYAKYSPANVATVCTYNTYHGRSAIRDLGKAMEFSPEDIDAFAKRLPHIGSDNIRAAIDRFPELKNSNLNWQNYAQLIKAAEKIADFPRFIGTHLGGVVICKEPLANLVPLQYSAKGVIVTQYDKDYIEDLGLVKLDLLSLRTFSAIQDSVELIKLNENKPGQKKFDEAKFNYENLTLEDRATYNLLKKGQTLGVFQLESPAQRALQSRLKADNIEDVVASLALIRPGPIKGNMVEPYIARRHGLEDITYAHPKLKTILEKTFGVVLFQEQVIEIATVIAGFTPGEADKLRRVMTHARSKEEMASIGEHFTKKAIEQGVEEKIAREIFSYMAGYASYGFCEAHAAAFATTAYKTAYLSQHYPAEFFAALLSHQPLGYYPPNTLCVEARNRGIKILSPDINLSEDHFTVEKLLNQKGIRVSLKQVKGISQREITSILEARQSGFFNSYENFCERTEVSKTTLERLVLCGGFDSLEQNRRKLLWDSLVEDFSYEDKLFLEYEILGINVKEHFMSYWRERLQPLGIKTSKEVKKMRDKCRVKVAGLTIRPHRPPTKSGKTIVFLSLEDEFGLTDITIFNNIYEKYGTLLFSGNCPPLIITGTLQRRGQGVSVVAEKIECVM